MRVEIVKSNVPSLPVYISDSGEKCNNYSKCDFHVHDEVEILVIIRGCIEVLANGESYNVEPGDVVIINRRIPHSTIRKKSGSIQRLLQFKIEKLTAPEFEHMNRYLSLLISGEEKPIIFIGKDNDIAKEISKYIECIKREEDERQSNYEVFIRGYMDLILGTLFRNNILKDVSQIYNSNAVKKIWPVLNYIDNNFEKQITLDKLSNILNMNKQYFCRLFKKVMDITPTEYINFVRVWKSENLLTTTDESVLEISMAVGFSSVSYFNRVFKRLKKTTPTGYRNIVYAKNKMM